ncbi:hypothetical protein E2562_033472 [Oryza meyeriana var. granulata]|uniref:Uncharacterized protein n=1 Tax=Oryza meyeriana var. granulata TaxID=110450 RepID=A0A6G1E679_9ORYZ|nr:hypothetical protein E2562_033472 [Oryza meyeriana var. granulata]
MALQDRCGFKSMVVKVAQTKRLSDAAMTLIPKRHGRCQGRCNGLRPPERVGARRGREGGVLAFL